jgi:Domain of unknown function (DUF6933)
VLRIDLEVSGRPMILRLSQKLAKKVKASPTRVLPLDANPFADWSAHLFTADRTQYILFSNTASLYSTVLYGAGITWDGELIKRGLSQVREVMTDDELEFFYLRFVAPASGTVQISKALNRSVTGLQNDFVAHAKFWLAERELSPYEVSFKLNETPMAPHSYANPLDVLKSLHPEASKAN